MTALEKTEAVEKELERCGYFCIVTSDNMSAQDAYLLYYGRDSPRDVCRKRLFHFDTAPKIGHNNPAP